MLSPPPSATACSFNSPNASLLFLLPASATITLRCGLFPAGLPTRACWHSVNVKQPLLIKGPAPSDCYISPPAKPRSARLSRRPLAPSASPAPVPGLPEGSSAKWPGQNGRCEVLYTPHTPLRCEPEQGRAARSGKDTSQDESRLDAGVLPHLEAAPRAHRPPGPVFQPAAGLFEARQAERPGSEPLFVHSPVSHR